VSRKRSRSVASWPKPPHEAVGPKSCHDEKCSKSEEDEEAEEMWLKALVYRCCASASSSLDASSSLVGSNVVSNVESTHSLVMGRTSNSTSESTMYGPVPKNR